MAAAYLPSARAGCRHRSPRDFSLLCPACIDDASSIQAGHKSEKSRGDRCLHPARALGSRKDINHNRIPSVILEARCHNDWCVDSEGKADHNLNSVPIQHEILVLHREVKGCVLSFKLETKMVTVGCTCVYPVVTERL
ncbi:interleukin-17F-like [Hyperolius riggenbachi]|uniref:interleukin-17F-like n=1 Tax=Hyperolius riggenbachi TaxID=752182 RepID=UPI0035A27602